MKQKKTAGFTIIELLIATAVFSVVLLTISAAVVQIGRLYYKGITSSRTQAATRAVMDNISQAIQFDTGGIAISPANPSDSRSRGICIVNKHYSYKFGQQHTDTPPNIRHALVVQSTPGGCSATPAQNMQSPTVGGTELLGENMRLSNLEVSQIGSTSSYRVVVRVIYGDDDLLCSASLPGGSCTSSSVNLTPAQIEAARDLSCKNIRSGTQFCAMSELSTIVERRLSE